MARKPNQKFTYGYGRATILAAYMNALILFIAVGGLGWEAIIRMKNPEPVQGGIIAIVSGIGIIINALTAWMFYKDRKTDLNIKATFLHMAGDALVSVGVLISGIVIRYTGWNILDPVVSLVLLAVVVAGSWGLLSDSVLQILDRVPRHLEVDELENYLLSFDGVKSIHDLHVWNLTTQTVALTTHIVLESDINSNSLIHNIQAGLKEKFKIHKSTIQTEMGKNIEEHLH
jgi:cobalt-zinc-cadmium efflux system protein